MSDSHIEIESGGSIRLPPGILRQMRTPVGTEFAPLVLGENVLLLFRHEDAPSNLADWADKCAVMGKVGAFGIADLFSTLNMGQKTGALVFETGHISKRVYFENGEIVFAVSDEPNHRLGEILIKRGKLTRQLADDLIARQSEGTRLGALLIEEGVLTAKDLYEAVRYQVEEIIYSIFPMQRGSFFFFEGDLLAEDLSQFTLNTQNILMEGYRRMDEWGQMREKIPHDGVILMRKEAEETPKFDSALAGKLYESIDGKKSVRELMRVSGMGDFDVTRALYDLLRHGAIETFDPKQAGESGTSLENIVESYNKLFMVVAQALGRSGKQQVAVSEQLQEYISGLDERAKILFDGVAFSQEKGFRQSMEQLLKNLDNLNTGGKKSKVANIAGLGDLFKRQQLQSVMDELLNYFLFTLKNALPPEQADTFIQKIRAAHRRLRETQK